MKKLLNIAAAVKQMWHSIDEEMESPDNIKRNKLWVVIVKTGLFLNKFIGWN